MHLWTEYEGRTIAEHYTLGRLLRSEGRNGFFATADKDGHPAVIRLTEAHYDEAEQLRRWRQVADVHQDNLIEIEQVGQTTFEGVALTYALMEPDDANLGDVLQERPMTIAETMQVAKAVLSALKALHERGLVHEHVEPTNVLAVGETVKLRSDCVRECVADGEFATEEACAELRRADLRAFGTLLLRCLTLETEWLPAHNNLPDPFKRIIPRALDGSWSLDQLGVALDPALFAPKPPERAALPLASVAMGTPAAAQAAQSSDLATAAPDLASPVGTPATAQRPLVPPGVLRQGSEPAAAIPARPPLVNSPAEPAIPVRTRFQAEPEEPTREPSRLIWAVVGVAALLLLFLAWHFFSGSKTEAPVASTSAAAPAVPSASAPAAVRPTPSGSAETGIFPARPAAPPSAAAEPSRAAGASGWYVVAFTYNHENQAAAKVQRLRRTHNSLRPQVFTPTGRAPYFVALGGPMGNQGEAEAVYRHARRSGLPRDTFVRHY